MFTRWLLRDRRLRDDPLAFLTAFNADTDCRHERRALSTEETALLLKAAESAPAWRGMSGENRAMLYRVALGAGLRAGELRSLTPRSFDLSADPPTVTVSASYSKRRRTDEQPIRPDLADLLRRWLTDKPADDPVFNVPEKQAEMLRADLRRARARWIRVAQNRTERRQRLGSDFLAVVDHAGRVLDFHALRHTYISRVVESGGIGQGLPRAGPTLHAHAHNRPLCSHAATRPIPGFGQPARCGIPGAGI